jgi:hypothetical protein
MSARVNAFLVIFDVDSNRYRHARSSASENTTLLLSKLLGGRGCTVMQASNFAMIYRGSPLRFSQRILL